MRGRLAILGSAPRGATVLVDDALDALAAQLFAMSDALGHLGARLLGRRWRREQVDGREVDRICKRCNLPTLPLHELEYADVVVGGSLTAPIRELSFQPCEPCAVTRTVPAQPISHAAEVLSDLTCDFKDDPLPLPLKSTDRLGLLGEELVRGIGEGAGHGRLRF